MNMGRYTERSSPVLEAELRHTIRELQNQAWYIRNRIEGWNKQTKFADDDVTPERVMKMWKEANIALPDLVCKRLEDVRNFHLGIQTNRAEYAKEEIAELEIELAEVEQRIADLEKQCVESS